MDGITAAALADHLDRMVAKHGDLPVDQWDADTSDIVRTIGQAVTFKKDKGLGDVIVVGNAGYDWDQPSIAASELSRQLRGAIATHGDHPVHQRDADTGWLLRFEEQRDRTGEGRHHDSSIVIAAVHYGD